MLDLGFPLIRKGWVEELKEGDAEVLVPSEDEAEVLAARFDEMHRKVLERRAARRARGITRAPLLNATTETLIRLYPWELTVQSIWVIVETAARLLSPVALREFLRWLQADANAKMGGAPEMWQGWMWALAVAAGGGSLTLIHHMFFWVGMRLGYVMRQQVVSAIHAKVLRLNSASVAYASTGHVVNLASNDVRRFDDALPFWVYIWSAPLETLGVLIMVALELGWVPAIAGVSAMLAVMPLQALLVQFVGGLRRATAAKADERVRLTGEVVGGALAMKMLGWEDPFTEAICGIRKKEVAFSSKMAQIRGLNLALQFAMTPLVTFVTFATYRALNRRLNIPSVFYALSLLNLPKLTMVYFFVMGVQFMAELKVSLRRIDNFLSMPEPPPPTHQRHVAPDANPSTSPTKPSAAAAPEPAAAAANGANSANGSTGNGASAAPTPEPRKRSLSLELVFGRASSAPRRSSEVDARAAAEAAEIAAVPPGGLRLGGADYDWGRNIQQLGLPPRSGDDAHSPVIGSSGGGAVEATPAKGGDIGDAAAGDAAGDEVTPQRVTLDGIVLDVAPGELLGIAGEVGSGKSSVLAALLGELQPLKGPDGVVKGGPVVRGRVAYCSQIPWIVAGTVRENILFGAPLEESRYRAVLSACALEQDLEELPAGDETELGERGVNLSGGQKARVALARAAYSTAEIVLLDDPLSAVDPRVGRILFEKCIGPSGLMSGRTRVLVTHQRQFLPRVDRVAVLRGGRLIACGPWDAVAAMELPELAGGEADGGVTADEVTAELPAPAGKEKGKDKGKKKGKEDERKKGKKEEAAAPPAGGVAVSLPLSRGAADAAVQAAAAGDGAAAADAAAAGDAADESAGDGSGDDFAAFAVEEGEEKAGRPAELERIRTMAPDINARPADSGRAPTRYFGGAFSRSGPFGQGLRALSRAFSDIRLGSLTGAATAPSGLRRGAGSGGAIWRSFRLFPGAESEKMPRSSASISAIAGGGSTSGGGGGGGGGTMRVGQLVKAETRETGGVSWGVYGRYCKQAGVVATTLVLSMLVAGQTIAIAAEWWLAMWARAGPRAQRNIRYIWVYGVLVACAMIVSLIRASMFFAASLTAATRMHDAMVTRVLRAPLSFFHTTPVGRILNRFSNDLGRVDDQMPMSLFDALQIGCMVMGALILVAIAVPVVLPVFVPLLVAFFMIRKRYIVTSREVKRLEAITRSPVYAAFSATLKGLPTIRAYGAQRRFHDAFLSLQTLNGSWWYAFLGTSRWVGFRLDVISTITLAAGVFLAMAIRDRISAAILALALTHVLQLTGMLQWWVRQTAEVENSMTSVERMLEYTELEQEPPRLKEGGAAPPAGWPTSGTITYTNVWASYRPGLPPVLRDLTFSLPPGCSCGVVGRTGSGKSSLMLTLFRLIQVDKGTITLDGLDTSKVALDVLRRQLAIIPQDPVLFSGTLRSNLDPWNRHADADLWDVLGAVQLKPAIAAAGGLLAPMAEAGDNLSVGQRQLFCLARALLQDAKVLALDEATANVDRATDALIQSALRDFAHGARAGGGAAGRVLLVIAHRIDTILDTDRLLVLSNGELVESGAPGELQRRAGGVFAGMVDAARAAAEAAAAAAAAATAGEENGGANNGARRDGRRR